MNMHKFLLLAVACTWSLGAAAQWQWTDKEGRKVFSDRPPPSEIPQKNILKQPGGIPAPRPTPAAAPSASDDAPATAGGAAAAPTVPAVAAKPPASAPGAGKDKALEDAKAQLEAAEAAKKKAAEEKQAKAKADNCARARTAKTTYDTGRPITQANAQGERIFLDEAGRAAEVKRIDSIIASDCAR